jgi:predicted transcriptional regulator
MHKKIWEEISMTQGDIIQLLKEKKEMLSSDEIIKFLGGISNKAIVRQLRKLRGFKMVSWKLVGNKYYYWIDE